MALIDQKEYLKRYLSSDSTKEKNKKRRKKTNVIKDRVKIIDDDIDDVSVAHKVTQNELEEFLTTEDAPQVVGIIDDRPLALRLDDYRKSDKWKLVGIDEDSDVDPPRNKSPVITNDPLIAKISMKVKTSKAADRNESPVDRRSREDSDSDLEVQRKRKSRHSDSDLSPDRNVGHKSPTRRKSRWSSGKEHERKAKKMTKTLDGKSAGLQNAKELKVETTAFKKREDELFENMPENISGKNAAVIMRDRKTGKKRDLVREAQEEMEKQKRISEQKEKYDAWGKGLKQVEDYNSKLQEDLHEMSKPLARYADDKDLDQLLREREREGDPMLEYMRKKKKKKIVKSGKPLKPVYDGEFMPNRYGIPPGHRWDGVDRSNGYEKQWFAKQNAKVAIEEEVYKWSTEDM